MADADNAGTSMMLAGSANATAVRRLRGYSSSYPTCIQNSAAIGVGLNNSIPLGMVRIGFVDSIPCSRQKFLFASTAE